VPIKLLPSRASAARFIYLFEVLIKPVKQRQLETPDHWRYRRPFEHLAGHFPIRSPIGLTNIDKYY